MELRRGFDIKDNDNILIVEDIVTTGGSIFELVDIVKKYNGHFKSHKRIFGLHTIYGSSSR